MGSVQACLDEVLAFWLRDEWLQFRGGEGVDETSLGHDQQQNLRSREGRQFVRLQNSQQACIAYDGTRRAFFMIPALRLEKVM